MKVNRFISALLGASLSSSFAQELPTTGTIDSRFGKLEIINGFPTEDTVKKLYDELDFQRACQAYIWALPYMAMTEWQRWTREEFGAGKHLVGSKGAGPRCRKGKATSWQNAHQSLRQRDNPPPTKHVKPGGRKWLAAQPRGIEYRAGLAKTINQEPAIERDRMILAMLVPLGIEEGKPFEPDERQKKILTSQMQPSMKRTTSSIPLTASKRSMTYSTDAVNSSSTISCSARPSEMGRRVAKAARSLLTMSMARVFTSRTPLSQIEPFKNRMGWQFKWVSSYRSDFNYDFHVSATKDELEREGNIDRPRQYGCCNAIAGKSLHAISRWPSDRKLVLCLLQKPRPP
jgi:Bacterial protein of unknown function (DUF899)